VGQVRSVNPQTTNVTYRVDDGTGVIDVKKWVDAEKADDPDHADPRFAPDTYVRVWGRLTSFNGRKHVGAHCIRAVTDFNEVNYHMLEATYVHLCLTKGGPPSQQQGGGGNAAGGDAMFVDQAGYGGGGTGAGGNAGGFGSGSMAAVAACSKNAKNVFNFMANSPGGNEGLHINFIASGMGMSIRDVLSAVDELMGQGALYNTVDDETFAILDY
jgi:replication factor A2